MNTNGIVTSTTELVQGGTSASPVSTPAVEQINPKHTEVSSSISQIERAATQVNMTANAVLSSVSKSDAEQRPPSVRQQLEKALMSLRNCDQLERIKDNPVSIYWKHKSVCGKTFETWSVGQFTQYSAKQLIAMKGAGRVRLLGLVDALTYAATGGRVEMQMLPEPSVETCEDSGYSWASKLPEDAKSEVRFLFEQTLGQKTVESKLMRVLKQIPRVIGFEPLVLMWLQGKGFHRRLAERLGVTESRVSQILAERSERLRVLLKTEMPEMIEKWESLLTQPAVPEQVFMEPWFAQGFDAKADGVHIHKLLSFFLTVMGASHPTLHSGSLEWCWCKDPEDLRRVAKEISSMFPMSDDSFRSYLGSKYPNLTEEAFHKAAGRTVVHVRHPGMWFSDRKAAVDYVLTHSGRPMTRNEIAKALGVKVTQTKALLLEHDGLERIGSNLKRVYCLKAKSQS